MNDAWLRILNVVEEPSLHSKLLDEDWWTNKNTDDSNYVDDDKSPSKDKAPIQNNSVITPSPLKLCSKGMSMNHVYSLKARCLSVVSSLRGA